MTVLHCNTPISIHALLAESDHPVSVLVRVVEISIHALLAESDPVYCKCSSVLLLFLSTLSLRRATGKIKLVEPGLVFLSTLSLRRATAIGRRGRAARGISIHALLAESDVRVCEFVWGVSISIHALLAESDLETICCWRCNGYFYPRSPCGERRKQYGRI